MSYEQDTQKQEDAKRAEHILEMARDIKEFALVAAFELSMRPSSMLAGIAVALVELNHDYTRGDEDNKKASLEDMIKALRAVHSEYSEAKKRGQAMIEAEEARRQGNIQ